VEPERGAIFVSGDDFLVFTRKTQSAPDLRYFKIFEERFYLDGANPDILHDEITMRMAAL
jgi:hypothetical protein